MKAMEKLVNFFESKRNSGKTGRMRLGNHYVTVYENGDADFVYHWTVIAAVKQGKAVITYGDWNTSSTNRACNSYVYELGCRGFDIDDQRKAGK